MKCIIELGLLPKIKLSIKNKNKNSSEFRIILFEMGLGIRLRKYNKKLNCSLKWDLHLTFFVLLVPTEKIVYTVTHQIFVYSSKL